MNEDTPRLVIKSNNTATNDPCALCGQRTAPDIGPELFLDGTWSLVCYDCGMKYDPQLTLFLLWSRQTEGDKLLWYASQSGWLDTPRTWSEANEKIAVFRDAGAEQAFPSECPFCHSAESVSQGPDGPWHWYCATCNLLFCGDAGDVIPNTQQETPAMNAPTKDELLAKYAEPKREVHPFYQLDGFYVPGCPDPIIRPDEDGDCIFHSTTHEIRASGDDLAVRVLIHRGTRPEDARRILQKMLEDVERAIEFGEAAFSGRLPAPPF